jgi:RNA polymerase sigma factor (sigma-70 family)
VNKQVMGPQTDYQLWQQFKQGNTSALERIFIIFYDDLYGYGIKLSRDEELVKDCIQNLFYKLWKNRNNLENIKSIKPYLFKALRHTVGDELQANSRKRKIRQEQAPEYEVVFSQEDFLISQQHSKEQSERIAAALNKLSSRQREAVYLRFFEGVEYEKIAEIMSINTQSVRNLIHQSFKILKENIVLIEAFYLFLQTIFMF